MQRFQLFCCGKTLDKVAKRLLCMCFSGMMKLREEGKKERRKEEGRGMFMNWWNLSVFCIIPIVSVIFFFFWKRKYLWIAPLTSTVISVAISLFAMPSILSDAEHRSMFFGISVMLHILIAVVLTVIAYVVARFLDKK
ncbi:hypothetical protein [Anaerotignum sp.]|uniref:hypothetical protein n=2 Tax=Anaerotignum sp. TaxID=2039241 RepID=UPI003A8EB4CB